MQRTNVDAKTESRDKGQSQLVKARKLRVTNCVDKVKRQHILFLYGADTTAMTCSRLAIKNATACVQFIHNQWDTTKNTI